MEKIGKLVTKIFKNNFPLTFLIAWLLSCGALLAQGFTDISKEAGLEHYFEVYEGMFGGGVAVLDFNNDGFEDLYLTGGMQPDQLLLNQGDGSFEDQLEKAGMLKVLDFVTQGVAAADFNRDGFKDLFITTITLKNKKQKIPRAQNLIFINQGDGTFVEESVAFGLDQASSFSTGVAVGDVNRDGYPDVYVGNYFTDYDGGLKEISDATIVNAGKTAKGYLYINRKGKKLVESYEDYGLNHRGFSFGGVFTDFDNDHDMDLIVNNDFGYKAKPSYLLENQYPKKGFKYVEKSQGMDLRINAMGAATADVDGDGWLDYFITNIRFNRMMVRDSIAPTPFVDQANSFGLELFTISWGAVFADFDLDGDEDLFVSNGDLNPNCVPMHNFYFEKQGSKFEEKSLNVGLRDYGLGRGAAIFDLENDGDMDLLLINQKAVMQYGTETVSRLYRNENKTGNYLKVKLHGTQSTPSGFGARIETFVQGHRQTREIDGGNSSHLSHNSTIAHFGLGEHTQVDSLKITWPGGFQQKFIEVPVNQLLEVKEPNYSHPSNFPWKTLIIISIIIVAILKFRASFMVKS